MFRTSDEQMSCHLKKGVNDCLINSFIFIYHMCILITVTCLCLMYAYLFCYSRTGYIDTHTDTQDEGLSHRLADHEGPPGRCV